MRSRGKRYLMVTIAATALAVMSPAAAALFGRPVITVAAVPLILVAIVFAVGAWNARTPRPDGLTTGERRHPGDRGIEIGGEQIYGAAGGNIFGDP